MRKNGPNYDLKAPGSPDSGASLRLPGRGPFPGVDDRLVEPEVTRDEIIGGVRVVASPAQPPQATQHNRLNYLLRAHVVSGYTVAANLLTRYDEESDFASHTCLFKDGVDPVTGGRYLEEIAFVVVSEQNERYVTEKALRMHGRGVRRIFTVWVERGQRLCEWSPESQSWCPLEADAQLEDPCLVTPLPVAALFDAEAADNAVVEALVAKGNPVLRKLEAEAAARGRAKARAKGLAKGAAETILIVLEVRGIAVSAVQREEILRCDDLDRLNRWLRRAATFASSTDEVTSEP
jgi:hypothetical protein